MATGCAHLEFDAPLSFRDAGMTDEAYASRVRIQTSPLVTGVGALSGVEVGVVVRGDRSLCVPYDTATTDPDMIIAEVRALLPTLIRGFALLFFGRMNDVVTVRRVTCPVLGCIGT